MVKPTDQDIADNFKHLDSTPVGGEKSVMTMEAVIDATPQQLRILRPYSESSKQVPTTLPAEAQIVLHALLSCFEKQKAVQEGLIGDLIWGFEQVNIPHKCTVMGLAALHKAEYVRFQAPDNTFIDFESDKIGQAWVRYQPKLLDMVYAGPAPL